MKQPREKDPTGKDPHAPGAKLDDGKLRAGLLLDFALALDAVAKVATMGAKKYSEGGWQAVIDGEDRYKHALWRHLLKARHEPLDPDSGFPHLWHALWNLAAMVELQRRREEGIGTPQVET